MIVTKLFNDFFHSEKSGGIFLIICTVISLILTNSVLQPYYASIWNYDLGGHSVTHWINDGLMAIFFLLIGLELEREIYIGELSNFKNALLPIFAAVGGMLFPAAIHLMINYGSPFQAGAGIPMATDIAFALGVLSLLGNRVPLSLKIFLTALAVIDDLGAILIIAIFYTGSIEWQNLLTSLGIFAFLLVLNRLKVKNLIPYLIAGIGMWYFMLHSGIHATITGVLLAFAIPFRDGSVKSPSYILQHFLHRPVAFIILPLFALANTSIVISSHWYQVLLTTNSMGIMGGLILGKPLGIVIFSYLSIRFKLTTLPGDFNYKQMIGVGFLGGIGFTMSIFISILAFDDDALVQQSKIAVMLASLVTGLVGYLILKWFSTQNSQNIQAV
ncbi:MAG TPA: Na+/H+ antiporter NhaA [Ohtaekwangia sp.]|nr:Na+/H+ antiporter NhaA [Ohtaekwangia sp.]